MERRKSGGDRDGWGWGGYMCDCWSRNNGLHTEWALVSTVFPDCLIPCMDKKMTSDLPAVRYAGMQSRSSL